MVDGFEQYRRNKVNAAMRASALATARLQGLKLGVFINPPQAAEGHMPFKGHRSCDQWDTAYARAKHRKAMANG